MATWLVDFHEIPADYDWPLKVFLHILQPQIIFIEGTPGWDEVGENQLLDLCRGCNLSQFRGGRMRLKNMVLQPHVAGIDPSHQLVDTFFVGDFMNQDICPVGMTN